MSNPHPSFEPLSDKDPLKDVLKAAFQVDLPVRGGWGYTKENATELLQAYSDETTKTQTVYMLASMRTQIEMNLTRHPDESYGAINLKQTAHEIYHKDDTVYECYTYEIDAIKQNDYHSLIQEYKENYGKADFDLEAHFAKRKALTLTRTVWYWISYSAPETQH